MATERWAGVLDGLQIERGDESSPARYTLRLASGERIELNSRIGRGLSIEFTGAVTCRFCGKQGRRSFGGGYCYDCFRALARCDVCVMIPARCHYHAGTCREPAWGESFCMQPHLVYLANSSGLKVGITRQGSQIRRWLDQGAIQGLVILDARTRRDAGIAEAQIAELLPDRTDWRKMLRGEPAELDLLAAAADLEVALRRASLELGDGVRWLSGERAERLRYPLPALHSAPRPLKPAGARRGMAQGEVAGNLVGMKGQYLVLTSGALNLRLYAGFEVQIECGESLPPVAADNHQPELF